MKRFEHGPGTDEGPASGPPLTPGAAPARWERAVAGILGRAEPELSRRAAASRGGIAILVYRWAGPLLAAAAGLVLAAAASLMLPAAGGGAGRIGADEAAAPEAPREVRLREAVYPGQVAAWMDGDYEPTVEEIVFSAAPAVRPGRAGGRP